MGFSIRSARCIASLTRSDIGEKYPRLAELDFLDAALSFYVMHEEEWGLDAHAEPVII